MEEKEYHLVKHVDGTFTLADATVFEGTVLMIQTFEGYDREVVIALGADGVRRP